MPVFLKEGIAFIHVPKCAGTSIEVALGWADRYPGIGFEPTETEPDHEHLFGGGLQHLTAKELRERHLGDTLRELFSFAVVRDPLDRLASHYLWRTCRFRAPERPLEEMKRDFRTFIHGVGSRYGDHPAFRSPKLGYRHDPSEPAGLAPNDTDRHLLPQCAFLFADGKRLVDNLFTLPRLPDLHDELRRRMPACRGFERRMASRSPWKPGELYTDDAIRAARHLYRDDCVLYRALTDSGGIWVESPSEPTGVRSA